MVGSLHCVSSFPRSCRIEGRTACSEGESDVCHVVLGLIADRLERNAQLEDQENIGSLRAKSPKALIVLNDSPGPGFWLSAATRETLDENDSMLGWEQRVMEMRGGLIR